MFSYHQSHELKSSTSCTNCGDDFVKLIPHRAQTLSHEEVRYYLQCNRCLNFRYGTEAWDIKSVLAIIDSETWGASNPLQHIADEPLDLSIRRENVGRRSHASLIEGREAEPTSTSGNVVQQRAYSPQPGTSSGLPVLEMRPFRPDLFYTTNSVNEEEFTKTRQLIQYLPMHTAEMPDNKCEFCGKHFTHKGNLTQHRRIHTGERHKCTLCPKSFTRPNILKAHQRLHFGETPYRCEICGKHYSYKNGLTYHQRVVHRDRKI